MMSAFQANILKIQYSSSEATATPHSHIKQLNQQPRGAEPTSTYIFFVRPPNNRRSLVTRPILGSGSNGEYRPDCRVRCQVRRGPELSGGPRTHCWAERLVGRGRWGCPPLIGSTGLGFSTPLLAISHPFALSLSLSFSLWRPYKSKVNL